MRPFVVPLCLLTVLGNPVHAGGAACVMAKFEGKTLDYALVYGTAHPVEAQERAEAELGRDHPTLARYIDKIGRIAQRKGDLPTALRLHRQAAAGSWI